MAKMGLLTVSILVIFCLNGLRCAWIKEMENPGLYEGDIVLDPDEREGRFKNSYASIKGGRWPNAKIPYYIERSIGSRGVSAINSAIEQYHKHTCLRFFKRTNERSYISFYSGSGCSSPVGYRSRRNNRISLAGNCQITGIAMHEIGHSIGLYHEQSRPDRDLYVKILWNNIQFGKSFNFNKKSTSTINSLGTAYDFRSMMHYGSTAFGGRRRTIETLDPKNQRLIGQRRGFSEIDIKQINLMYCGGATVQPPVTSDVSTNKPATRDPTVCDNQDIKCNGWASEGWCKKDKVNEPMKRKCCKACKEHCADKHDRCQEWANRTPSECTVNPGYMLNNCRTSCKVCYQ